METNATITAGKYEHKIMSPTLLMLLLTKFLPAKYVLVIHSFYPICNPAPTPHQSPPKELDLL